MLVLDLFLVLFLHLCSCISTTESAPRVSVKNGTIIGRRLSHAWDQDLFLGIPFAKPPTGSLRFKRPRELNSSYPASIDASNYGSSCYQHPNVLTYPNLTLSEDCLTLNVVRPSGTHITSAPLPVLVWIYGGGFFSGSSADPQYNLSGIVRSAQDVQTPIIAVSLNYRVGVMGFFQSPEIFTNRETNAGLFDQRLALRWIRENIEAFGGDPQRITVWGESSGAQSIALHLHSYGGKDDGLFRAAIMESGGFVGTPLLPPASYVAQVDSLVRATGCNNATDSLKCLREIPVQEIYAAPASNFYWNPIVDGDLLTDYPSTLAASGDFIRIPLLIGANSDEGITFGPRPISGTPFPAPLDSATDISSALVNDPEFAGMPGLPYQISPTTAQKLLELYPNDPSQEPPYDIRNGTIFSDYGLQWRRSCAIYGDLVMIGSRRQLCAEYALGNQTVFSYRFDTRPFNAGEADGVGHFVNVVFSFQNISGALGPLPEFQAYKDLSTSIGRAYINFVYDHDPNSRSRLTNSSLQTGLPVWRPWTIDKPANIVLNATKSIMEKDDFRVDGIRFINSISRELLG